MSFFLARSAGLSQLHWTRFRNETQLCVIRNGSGMVVAGFVRGLCASAPSFPPNLDPSQKNNEYLEGF